MTVTLGEEVTLLSVDDESGAVKDRHSAGWAVAGGTLLELALAGRVAVDDGRLTVTDPTPTGDPLLDGRLAQLTDWTARHSKAEVGDWLAKDQAKAFDAAVDRLVDRGVLTERKHRVLGIFPGRRYPEADGSAERALRHRLEDVVLHGADPDARTTGLIALLHATGLHGAAFPDVPRDRVAPRMEALAEGQWVAADVHQALQDMQAVLAALVVTTTVATTITTTTT
ncbi:GPP34 family phosphoprotein [Streptomyces albus subsp. chlorinus]|uniref:GOLPH3/VPS74 family protein n=1 Tax=Streptomyces albus TaxID=1888 RepID=UPI00157009F6|nr:GPP34 family phosphoprotein [Streptomyces albus]NSC24552.1 GPP34 family phosphoprotein [Streptomyces albus subsp. chlorinus]